MQIYQNKFPMVKKPKWQLLHVNPNRRDYYKILLSKCIRCDCVITGTPKCAREHWPAGSWGWCARATTLLLTLFPGLGLRDRGKISSTFSYLTSMNPPKVRSY